MEEIVKDELDFYSKLSKNLIFSLPNYNDRALAAAWVKKIRDESSGTLKLRTDYIKLLLMALQRSHLVGIFADDPTKYESLEEFPNEFDINEMAKCLIEKENVERQDKIRDQLRGVSGEYPPYVTDCSSDFREYVAMQDVPRFGVHCYYALSKEPVNEWKKADKGIYPKEAKSTALSPSSLKVVESSSCVCPPAEGEEPSECRKRMTEDTVEKRKRGRKYGAVAPVAPIGTPASTDDRKPPTWGTNLLEIREKPKVGNDAEDTLSDENVADDDIFALPKGLDNIEQFLDEYASEQMTNKVQSELQRASKTGQYEKSNDAGTSDAVTEEDTEKKDDEECEISSRIEEVTCDSYLVEYFRMQLNQTVSQQQSMKRSHDVQTSSPARSLIPMTTPKASPIPRRPKPQGILFQEAITEKEDPTAPQPDPSVGTSSSLSCQTAEKSAEAKETSVEANTLRASVDEELNNWIKRLSDLEKECERRIRNCKCARKP